MQQTEYSTLTISWEASETGDRLVVLECRGDEGQPLWRHTMETQSAVSLGRSLSAAGAMSIEDILPHGPAVGDHRPMGSDGTGYYPPEYLPHPGHLEHAVD